MSSEQFDLFLVPTRRDVLTKSFKLSPEQWRSAIVLSRRHGYYPPDDFGLCRAAVRAFLPALRSALAGISDAESRKSVEELVNFCAGDGACGFVLEKRWRRATGAL